MCANKSLTGNEETLTREATAIVLRESVWGIVCASGREGLENAFVTATGPLEMASAMAWSGNLLSKRVYGVFAILGFCSSTF